MKNIEQNLFKHVKIFLNIVKTKNINKTSKEMFTSSSTITRAIQTLEQYLQTKLFTRHGCKGVEITKDGIAFANYAQNFMKSAQQIQSVLQQKKNIQIYFHPVAFKPYISNVLKKFFSIFLLETIPIDKEKLISEITNKNVDIALYPFQLEETLFIERNFYNVVQLKEYNLCLYMNKNHKLAKIPEKDITIEDLNNTGIVPTNWSTRIKLFQQLLTHKMPTNISLTSMDLNIISEGIKQNLWCIGIGDEFDNICNGKTIVKKLYKHSTFYNTKIYWYLIYKKNNQDIKKISNFIEKKLST